MWTSVELPKVYRACSFFNFLTPSPGGSTSRLLVFYSFITVLITKFLLLYFQTDKTTTTSSTITRKTATTTTTTTTTHQYNNKMASTTTTVQQTLLLLLAMCCVHHVHSSYDPPPFINGRPVDGFTGAPRIPQGLLRVRILFENIICLLLLLCKIFCRSYVQKSCDAFYNVNSFFFKKGDHHLVKEKWFTQRLDHYDDSDGRTWLQRYYVNTQFFDQKKGICF